MTATVHYPLGLAPAKTAQFWDAEAEAILNRGFDARARKWGPELQKRFETMGNDEAYHYLGSGKIVTLIGHGLGESMNKLLRP